MCIHPCLHTTLYSIFDLSFVFFQKLLTVQYHFHSMNAKCSFPLSLTVNNLFVAKSAFPTMYGCILLTTASAIKVHYIKQKRW